MLVDNARLVLETREQVVGRSYVLSLTSEPFVFYLPILCALLCPGLYPGWPTGSLRSVPPPPRSFPSLLAGFFSVLLLPLLLLVDVTVVLLLHVLVLPLVLG